MNVISASQARPPIHLPARESDVVATLALQAEQCQPVVAAMLLEEIERAELHDDTAMPPGHARLNSTVTFRDTKTGTVRSVQLVLPADADIEEGRVSIMTPIGAALYGLAQGDAIDWPDLLGNRRRIELIDVRAPSSGKHREESS